MIKIEKYNNKYLVTDVEFFGMVRFPLGVFNTKKQAVKRVLRYKYKKKNY